MRKFRVADYQWTPGHKWERFAYRMTMAEVRAEFKVDPRKVVTLIYELPFKMGKRIVVFA